MSNESESEDDLLELAYDYKLNGSYPEGCTLNKKRSIRRKADTIFVQNGEAFMTKKTEGRNVVGYKLILLVFWPIMRGWAFVVAQK